MQTVEITAHRGSSAKAPENTLAAMRQAITDGCDSIEIDVQTCADGTVVVLHDRDLRRVAGDRRRVEDLTLAELRRIDVGRRFSERFAGERVPTLTEVIHLVRGKVGLNVELKYNRPDSTLVPSVLDVLRGERFVDQCVISSVEPAAIRAFKMAEPSARLGLIVKAGIGRLPRMEVDFLSLATQRATPAFIRQTHRAGRQVHVWTVNKPEAMRQFIRHGVDNIITNKPDVLRAVLEEHARP